MLDFGLPQAFVLFVAALRLIELVYANYNTRRLLARGAVEIGASHYPVMVLLHTAWLVALFVLVPADAAINWYWMVVFGLLLVLRVWTLATLGSYWTTRIITLPGAPLVRRGPYRFIRHPNYVVVIGEILAVPMIFGSWILALVFSVLNLLLLAYRITLEDRTLNARRDVE